MRLLTNVVIPIISKNRAFYVFFFILLMALMVPSRFCLAVDGTAFLKTLFPHQESKQFSFSLRFDGNTFFKDAELIAFAQEELQIFETNSMKKTAVDDAAFKMELAYRLAGYPAVLVTYHISEQQGQYDLLFSVFEWGRVLLKSVHIEGNSSYTERYLLGLDKKLMAQLDKQVPFPYVEQQLQSFAGSLVDFYLAEGFLDVTVNLPELIADATEETFALINILINEGPQYRVGEIRSSADIQDQIQDITAAFENTAYNPRLKLLLRSRIQEQFQNKGFSDVSTAVDTIKRPETKVMDLVVDVQQGEPTSIQEIVVQGNDGISEEYIRRRIKLAVGQPYTLETERASFSGLYQTGLFAKVHFALEQLDKPGNKKLIVEVEEKPAKEFFIEPGWGSYELLRVAVGYTDKNLFGTGRSFRLDNNVSSKSSQVLAGFTDHYFLNTTILADLPIYYRYRKEPDYAIEENGVGMFLSKKFDNKSRVSGGYSYSAKKITDIETTLDPLYIDNNYTNAALTLSLSRDTRDDFFLPKSGYHGNVSLEYADTIIGGDLSYLRFTTSVRNFKKIQDQLVLAMRYNMGVVLPGPGQDGIPLDERFFNGGENSVRSFRESQLGTKDSSGASLGGTAFNTISVELRRTFTTHIAGTFFIDAGNISPNKTTNDGVSSLADTRQKLIDATWKDFFSDFRYGVGCGIQYLLPIGPARFDVAFNPDSRPETESEYAFHLSIGMAF
nr:outer membrane protein assembly factor BamA [Desulfobulbaceae bacterium]